MVIVEMDINASIIDHRGREVFSIGGLASWKQTTYKGYCVSLEWFQGARSYEPMLAIWPLISERESGVWGICLSSVGKFCEFDGNGKPTGAPTAEAKIEAAIVLSQVFDRPALDAEVSTLLDVLMRFIPDLIVDVPPAPREVLLGSGRQALFDVERVENGKTVAEVTI